MCQLADAEQKLAGAESEAEKLRSLLDVERGTALTSLSQFQKQQVGAQACSADACLALNGVNACAVRHLAAGDSWRGGMSFCRLVAALSQLPCAALAHQHVFQLGSFKDT